MEPQEVAGKEFSTADGAGERIRFEAQRYAESVRDGLVSTTDHLAELHQNLGQLLVELVAMEPKDEITLEEEKAHAAPEGDGEADPSWRWIR